MVALEINTDQTLQLLSTLARFVLHASDRPTSHCLVDEGWDYQRLELLSLVVATVRKIRVPVHHHDTLCRNFFHHARLRVTLYCTLLEVHRQ
jgi:hypothetical protein